MKAVVCTGYGPADVLEFALAWSMPVMYVAMLGAMFYRWGDYAQHHHGAAGAERHAELPAAQAPAGASQPSG